MSYVVYRNKNSGAFEAYATTNPNREGRPTWEVVSDQGVAGAVEAIAKFEASRSSDQREGVATLVAGTKVVTNSKVTAASRIFLTAQSLGTVTAPKALAVTARTAGTSFTITSADNTDTSVIGWHIEEPPVS